MALRWEESTCPFLTPIVESNPHLQKPQHTQIIVISSTRAQILVGWKKLRKNKEAGKKEVEGRNQFMGI
jgi:hypothetical protein